MHSLAMGNTQAPLLEHDFLGVRKDSSSAPPNSDRRRCFRGIQNAISKINPEVIKSVIASASSDESPFPALPLAPPPSIRSKTQLAEETAPMTIFHNGTVTVLDVTKDQAESILKMAMALGYKKQDEDKTVPSSTASLSYEGDVLEEGLPVARRKSLERFFEKRKERLMSVSPYEIPKCKANAVPGEAGRWAW